MKKKLILLLTALLCVIVCLSLIVACEKPNKKEPTPSENATVVSISIKTQPSTTTFELGSDFSSSGLVIQANYSDDTKVELKASEYEIDSSTYDKNAVGTYSITIKYKADQTKSCSYDVTVQQSGMPAATLIGISIKTAASKTFYDLGESLSLQGLSIQADYSDNSSRLLNSEQYTIDLDAYNKNVGGSYDIVITLNSDSSMTCKYTVSVKAVTALAVKDGTLATAFASSGDYPDFSDVVIQVTYSDDSVIDITQEDFFNYFSYDYNFNEVGETSIKISLKTNNEVFVEYPVTIYDLATLMPKTISTSKYGKTDYFIGDDSVDIDNYELTLTYAEFGERPFYAMNYFADTSSVDFETGGEYTIKVYAVVAGEKIDEVFFEYKIHVYDVTDYELTSIAVDTNSAHIKDFYYMEKFSSFGLIINEIRTFEGAENIITKADDSTFSINADTYDEHTTGEYDIEISLLTNPEIKTSYKVNVLPLPLDGVYVDAEEENNVYIQSLKLKVEDGVFYPGDQAGFSTQSETITSVYRDTNYENSLMLVISTDGEHGDYRYDVDKDTVSNAVNFDLEYVISIESEVLAFKALMQEKFIVLLTQDGKISQKQIDGLATIGQLFLDAEGTSSLTSDTVFDKHSKVYLLFEQPQYTAAPFIGNYVSVNEAGEIEELVGAILPDRIELYGATLGYTAIQSDDDWHLNCAGITITYNSSNGRLLLPEGNENCYKLDETKYAIIEIVDNTEDERFNKYTDRFIVEIGKPTEKLATDEYILTCTIDDTDVVYNGEPITKNATFVIKEMKNMEAYFLNFNEYYGTVEKYFNVQNYQFVTLYENGAEVNSNGVLKLTKVENDKTYFTIELSKTEDDESVVKVLDTEGYFTTTEDGKLLVLTGSDYVGEYLLNDPDFYVNAPFIATYVGSAEDYQGLDGEPINATLSLDVLADGTITAIVKNVDGEQLESKTYVITNIYRNNDDWQISISDAEENSSVFNYREQGYVYFYVNNCAFDIQKQEAETL